MTAASIACACGALSKRAARLRQNKSAEIFGLASLD
jgi:hypothetical protein